MWAKHRNAPLESILITDESFVDLTRFRAFVHSIHEDGHNIAVATFGRRDVVRKAMEFAIGDADRIKILSPADFGHPDGSGALGDKNTQLAALASMYGVAADQIIFFDDDERNIQKAVKVGVIAQWAPQGMDKSMFGKARQVVGLPAITTMQAIDLASFVAPKMQPCYSAQAVQAVAVTGPQVVVSPKAAHSGGAVAPPRSLAAALQSSKSDIGPVALASPMVAQRKPIAPACLRATSPVHPAVTGPALQVPQKVGGQRRFVIQHVPLQHQQHPPRI